MRMPPRIWPVTVLVALTTSLQCQGSDGLMVERHMLTSIKLAQQQSIQGASACPHLEDARKVNRRSSCGARNLSVRMSATSAAEEDLLPPPTFQELLTQEAYCAEIAAKVASRIQLPFFCPFPIKALATKLVIESMASHVSTPKLVQRIGDFINQVSSEDMEDLASAIAQEINDEIDLPVLNEEQEEIALEVAVKAILKELSTNKKIKVNPKAIIDKSITTTQTLLGEESGRRELAKVLNAKVDFPFMNEEQEEALWMQTLDACADRLLELLPPQLIDTLQGEGVEGLETTKQFVVQQLNERLDIVGLTESQEAWLLENFVDTVLEVLIGDTETELFFMSESEQKEELEQRRAVVMRDLRVCKERFLRQQSALEGKLERIDKRLSGL